MSLPVDDKAAKKHWRAQEPSIDLPFGARDPGVTMLDNKDVPVVLAQEIAGTPVPVFKQRTSGKLADPVARSTAMIRNVTQKGQTSEQFYEKVETTEDLLLHLCLFGQMDDDKKASNLHKLSKLLWDKQKEVLKQNNIEQNLEEKRVRNALELDKKLGKLAQLGIIEGTTVDRKDGDV